MLASWQSEACDGDGAVWSARGRLYCCSCARLWGCSTLPSAPSTTPSVAHAKTPPTAKDARVKVSHCPVTQSIRFSQWYLTLHEHSADQCRHWKKKNEICKWKSGFIQIVSGLQNLTDGLYLHLFWLTNQQGFPLSASESFLLCCTDACSHHTYIY